MAGLRYGGRTWDWKGSGAGQSNLDVFVTSAEPSLRFISKGMVS